MYLQGQATRRSAAIQQAGFALAAMLVAIAVLSVMLIVALPTWRHLAQREKEAELIFRGEQYARAISLYQRKLAGALPPSIDILVEQKFLRQKYKDPITGEDFVPVYANSQAAMAAMPPGGPTQVQSRTSLGPDGRVTTTTTTVSGNQFRMQIEQTQAQLRAQVTQGQGSTQIRGTVSPGGAGANGIVGVMSKSKAQSIRLYNGRSQYDQWVFTYMSMQPQPLNAPGQPGSRGLPQPPSRGRGRGPGGQ